MTLKILKPTNRIHKKVCSLDTFVEKQTDNQWILLETRADTCLLFWSPGICAKLIFFLFMQLLGNLASKT